MKLGPEAVTVILDVEVIRRGYGKRLVDLIPTEKSWTYLWGDRLSSPTFTDGVRRWLRSNDSRDLPLSMRV